MVMPATVALGLNVIYELANDAGHQIMQELHDLGVSYNLMQAFSSARSIQAFEFLAQDCPLCWTRFASIRG